MKERLDVLLVKQKLADSRERAKQLIKTGLVFVNGQCVDKKAGIMIEEDNLVLEVRGETLPYVSRGGLKLEKAIRVFQLDLSGKVCMDAGASTGGFTDCMLQNGAEKVFAVDVGHGQLAEKLRLDERVVSLEGQNIRHITKQEIGTAVDFISVDVSFISLDKVLLPLENMLVQGGQLVCLIKPQFEAGREHVGKKGVVRDAKVHEKVLQTVISYASSIGLVTVNLDYSPIRGPEGNIEYLAYMINQEPEDISGTSQQKSSEYFNYGEPDIKRLVSEAHKQLK